jgi:hypothetical protein
MEAASVKKAYLHSAASLFQEERGKKQGARGKGQKAISMSMSSFITHF